MTDAASIQDREDRAGDRGSEGASPGGGHPPAGAASPGLVRSLIRLARLHQWSKSAFVLVGPFYAAQSPDGFDWVLMGLSVVLAAAAFGLASSGCYVFNDLADAERDRAHPRKRFRPIASGVVTAGTAKRFGTVLLLAGVGLALLIPGAGRWWVSLFVVLHIANVTSYTAGLKQIPIVDVMSLSMGFVLRVLAGCAAIGLWPTTWLLNVTLFLSMTLAFGKRLGERRTMGSAAAATAARRVQGLYSDDLLRMLLVVSAVATLLTYAAYVVTREPDYSVGGFGLDAGGGFNLLWLTVLPATFGLLRAIMLLEQGAYDDPTELAVHDRAFQVAAGLFGVITLVLMLTVAGRATPPTSDPPTTGGPAGMSAAPASLDGPPSMGSRHDSCIFYPVVV
ncbi:MAG: UbiA prenyltransferase family protein [Planctomycetota bacterium]